MLRRVIVHLRRQDCIAVVIELIVVVVGVFIGVQASNRCYIPLRRQVHPYPRERFFAS